VGNLRGVIAPIVDLKLNFGLANAALDGTTEAQRVGCEGVDSASSEHAQKQGTGCESGKKALGSRERTSSICRLFIAKYHR
jgi:hypothetical protein